MAVRPSNPFRIQVATPGTFSPPYALPGPGQSLALAAPGGNTSSDIAPAPFSAGQFNYSLFNSYGSGVFNEEYSLGGAFIVGGAGGHLHPDFTGMAAFDFSDGKWKLHEHQNGGTRYGGNQGDLGYHVSQTTGSPFYEILGSPEVPAPAHPYQNLTVMPSHLGGGARGSVMYVGRGALVQDGTTHSGALHRFDLATNRWHRINNNISARLAAFAYETGVAYDAPRGRYWICTQRSEGDSFLLYLRASDWTFRMDASFSGFPAVSVVGNGARAWMHGGIVFLQCNDGSLISFDPDNPGSNYGVVPIQGPAGAALPAFQNKFIYYPRTGRFYHIGQRGGATLHRLTPPTTNLRTSPWVHDTVTVAPPLPRQTQLGDGADLAEHYGALQYVPSIDRLAWFVGGSSPVYLLDPT